MVDVRWRIPPDFIMPEHPANDISPELQETLRRNQQRWGLLEDYERHQFNVLVQILGQNTCDCWRWIWTTTATVDGQTNFVTPTGFDMDDDAYQLVFARGAFQYLNFQYNILTPNTLQHFTGLLAGEPLSIYAMKHDDVQEVHYEHVAVPAAPYLFSPPLTVDRGAGRQLVFARTSFRFLDSLRLGDEYTVSDTINQISLTSGLGPIAQRACVVRLRECGVRFHEEVFATAAGQTVFSPQRAGNIVNEHATGRMIITARTTFLHPGINYVSDVNNNTITIRAPGLNVGDPLNMWVYR